MTWVTLGGCSFYKHRRRKNPITDSDSPDNFENFYTPNWLFLDNLVGAENRNKVDWKVLWILMKKSDLVYVFTVSQKQKYCLLSARATYFR